MSSMHRVLVIVAAVLGLAAAGADFRPSAKVRDLAVEIDAERDHISAIELAERIVARDETLRVFDLRSRAEYDQFHIPGAAHASLAELAQAQMPRNSMLVLYSEGGAHSAQAWVLMRMRGYRNVLFLREGIYEWISRVHEPRLAVDATEAERAEFERAANLSRFFGGVPLSGVPRNEVPLGYWSGATATEKPSTQESVAKIRRRGC